MRIAIGTFGAITTGITEEVTQNIQEQVNDIVSSQVEDIVQDKIDEFADDMTGRIENVEKILPTKADIGKNGKIVEEQLPMEYLSEQLSDFDEVLRFENVQAFPEIGDIGLIYIDESTGNTYTWSDAENGYKSTVDTIDTDDIKGIFN